MKLDTLHAQLDFTLNGLHWLLNEKVEGWNTTCCLAPLPARFTDSVKPFFRFMVPYSIQELSAGRYVVLNRGYKPLGIIGESYNTPTLDYSNYAVAGPKKLPDVTSVYAQHNVRFFFNDASSPWVNRQLLRTYMQRLEVFVKALA
ncbi:hypothetical protein C2O24_19950 [Salmonella enterica]|uniref:hypothetical protein n=1 Tax=Salmonella enterica TaxID=28901 RepID=UPI001E027FB8|nr:hypothetical protein [Salmonella enterica]EKE6653187.1 hypothetical protein [Salmonella enterica subsp. enterica serovar Bredeney]EBD6270244.1 hypothetical protein [Salmonella enterica]EFS4521347.1 hypothetical protein [Salmonella enterica]EGG9947153.1 hypothetical protein [Salmonella enterica]